MKAEVLDPSDDFAPLVVLEMGATSSGGAFSSDMLLTGPGNHTLESWSMTGTSSADKIDCSGSLLESGALLNISFEKPGGSLNELSAMGTNISLEAGDIVMRAAAGYDGDSAWRAAVSLSNETGSQVVGVEAHANDEWVSLAVQAPWEDWEDEDEDWEDGPRSVPIRCRNFPMDSCVFSFGPAMISKTSPGPQPPGFWFASSVHFL